MRENQTPMDEVRLKSDRICASFEEIEDKSIRQTIYVIFIIVTNH